MLIETVLRIGFIVRLSLQLHLDMALHNPQAELFPGPQSEDGKQSSRDANQQSDDRSILPFVTTDEIIRRHAETGATSRVSGVIQDFSGDMVSIRRGGTGKEEVLRLREIEQIRFRKSAEYEEGLRFIAAGDWKRALSSLTTAAELEPRPWVVREIMASQIRCLTAIGRRADTIQIVEEILESDPHTRHVALLPLVWDERLPESERTMVPLSDLESSSLVRKLTAASVWLHDDKHAAAAQAELHSLRLCGRKRIQELAEIQLWRVRVIHPDRLRTADTEIWEGRVVDFERPIRGPAAIVLGRAFLHQHQYDKAAFAFLWMPVLQVEDRPLAAASLKYAAIALQTAGRPEESSVITSELLNRFPETSSAQQVAAAENSKVPQGNSQEGRSNELAVP
ncbi:MAG: hypothetical protein JNL58_00810 [Planctomyces sp.]|nr:hypothetical protein [Planctomyces sp.]